MMNADHCRLGFSSNVASLLLSLAEDYPLLWLLSLRWRLAPWDCCCWTNSLRDKLSLLHDYILTFEVESSLNLRMKKRETKDKTNWNPLLLLLQIKGWNWYFIGVSIQSRGKRNYEEFSLFQGEFRLVEARFAWY